MFVWARNYVSSLSRHCHRTLSHPWKTVAGFGRLQNWDPFLNRSPLNKFDGDKERQSFCKGLHKKGGPGKKLKTGKNEFEMELDMAPHGGGSMQVSISFDNGTSFKVSSTFRAYSYIDYSCRCRLSSHSLADMSETLA